MMPPYKLTNDGAVAVAPGAKWRKIDADTPVGVKMLLINRANGIATVSVRRSQDAWTHWYALPTFNSEISEISEISETNEPIEEGETK